MSELDQVLELEEDTQKDKFLTFIVGNETYALEIYHVTEIIGIQSITEVPELPNYIKGIINLRGKIIPVMDVRLRFRKEFREYDDRTCIVVIDVNDMAVGLIVDTVAEVIDIPEGNISLPPTIRKSDSNKYIKGIGKAGDRVKLILDCQRLLSENELEEVLGKI